MNVHIILILYTSRKDKVVSGQEASSVLVQHPQPFKATTRQLLGTTIFTSSIMGSIYGVARITAGYELFESGDKVTKIQDFGFFNPKSTVESTAASIDAPVAAPDPQLPQEGEPKVLSKPEWEEYQGGVPWSPQ